MASKYMHKTRINRLTLMGFKTINSQEIYATCETSSPRVDESETKEFLVMHLPRFCEP